MQRVLEEVAEIEPDRRTDQRTEQGAGAADGRLHDELAGGVEHEGVGRHEALHDAEQAAGEARIGRSHDEGRQLVGVNVVADRRRAQRIVADRPQDRADRRMHDAPPDDEADEEPEGEIGVHGPVGIEPELVRPDVEGRRRHAGQAVLAAGVVGERAELDEVEHLGDRHRDHREIDAGAAQRDEPDQIADGGRHDHADDNRQRHIGEVHLRQQIGGDHAARAEERRLAERQQARVAEQDVEPETEQAPDQDAIYRRRREAEMRQDIGDGDEAGRGQGFGKEAARVGHGGGPIRGRRRRAAHRAAAPAPAS